MTFCQAKNLIFHLKLSGVTPASFDNNMWTVCKDKILRFCNDDQFDLLLVEPMSYIFILPSWLYEIIDIRCMSLTVSEIRHHLRQAITLYAMVICQGTFHHQAAMRLVRFFCRAPMPTNCILYPVLGDLSYLWLQILVSSYIFVFAIYIIIFIAVEKTLSKRTLRDKWDEIISRNFLQ